MRVKGNKFNYGHTFGHALESATGYAINHGQAVTVGMDIANMFSKELGLMDSETYKSIEATLKINFPEQSLSRINVESYINFLLKDKKNVDQQLTCILSEGPGMLVKRKIPIDASFRDRIDRYFSEH